MLNRSATATRPPVPGVLLQHAEEAATLRETRASVVRAPHVQLHRLQRLDERIAAHLDGLELAGEAGMALCLAALDRPSAGRIFATACQAIALGDAERLDKLVLLADALPPARRGLASALGWQSATRLRGLVQPLLASARPGHRALGLQACRLHGVDPGRALVTALNVRGEPVEWAEALRCAGELGRIDLLPACRAALAAEDRAVAHRAAVACLLLGDRSHALVGLERLFHAGEWQRDAAGTDAFTWLMLASPPDRATWWLRMVHHAAVQAPAPAEGAALQRLHVRACGLRGDTEAIPALIERMADDSMARLAGEAFSTITGADLAALDLERRPPDSVQAGANDDPDDDDVAMDEDDGLPWPDAARVQRWWQGRAGAMPSGARHFMGRPLARDHCHQVLRDAAQRHRWLATRHAALLQPGGPLFDCAAPAWRQQRLLAR